MDKNIDKVNSAMQTIFETDPAKFVDLYIKLAEFVIPKLTRTAISNESNENEVNIPMITWVKTVDAQIVTNGDK